MPDTGYPDGYNPTFDFEMPPAGYIVFGAIAIAALGAAAVGAFFTTSALAGGTAVAEGIVVNGTTYYGVSAGVAAALDAATTLETMGEADVIVEAALIEAAAARASVTSAALIILAAQQNEREAQGMFFPSGF